MTTSQIYPKKMYHAAKSQPTASLAVNSLTIMAPCFVYLIQNYSYRVLSRGIIIVVCFEIMNWWHIVLMYNIVRKTGVKSSDRQAIKLSRTAVFKCVKCVRRLSVKKYKSVESVVNEPGRWELSVSYPRFYLEKGMFVFRMFVFMT